MNRYYESCMGKLRQELVLAKASRDKVEFDLSRQIAFMDLERRQALEQAETTITKRKGTKSKKKPPQIGTV